MAAMSPAVEFRSIRPHAGSQNLGFEEMCCQLAGLDTPVDQPFQRKGAGADSGLECHRIERDGTETGWQAKYFFKFGESEAAQLSQSFEHAVAGHPRLATFVVCLPHDLSDARIKGRKSERNRWDDWVDARAKAIAPLKVSIRLWGSFELNERLGRADPAHVGRRVYWFDATRFDAGWFRSRFERAKAALGRRYSPELNVELPISRAFSAFARDANFARSLERLADRVDEEVESAAREVGDALRGIDDGAADRTAEPARALVRSMRSAPAEPADRLPLEDWEAYARSASAAVSDCMGAIWQLPRSDAKRRAEHRARQLHDALTEASDTFAAEPAVFANASSLLLTGDAGVGKSHLLADVAERHIASGGPAILVLGSWFADGEPWAQVAEQVGLPGTAPDRILGALDAAAEAAGTRALVLIDAINERLGASIWRDRLAAFLRTAEEFPRIAVAASCRTTFLPWIVPGDLDATKLPRLRHPGFAGRAAEAARIYLDQRGIVRMAAPNLAPEFENPLFLRTVCDALERRGERELPRGLAGVTAIFDFYFASVAEALTVRMALAPRRRTIERALAALTESMVKAGEGWLPLNEAINLLEGVHPSMGRQEQDLLLQLENEGVLAVEPVSTKAGVAEQVRFTFERLSDHSIASRLLDEHVGEGDPRPAFAEGGAIDTLLAADAGRLAGVAEALAVQTPERYGLDLPDLLKGEHWRWDLWHWFRSSLLLRRQDAFTARTMELVRELGEDAGEDAELATLLAVATEPDNPFNADHLDSRLRLLRMPERDVAWSIRVARLAEDESDGAVETLITWTLANGLEPIDDARARLTATALAWLLSTSHRSVRDKATKALATLLVPRRALAAELVESFATVDDPYVADRVLAAAYGAATRSAGSEGLAELARAADRAVFRRQPITEHALVRDHARGLVELAAARGVLPVDVDIARARPPYGPATALERVPDAVVGGYVQDLGHGTFRDDIVSSAIDDGDFARYVVDRVAGRFLKLPIADAGKPAEMIYREWRKMAIARRPRREAALARLEAAYAAEHALPFDWDLDHDERQEIKARRSTAEIELQAAAAALAGLLGPAGAGEFEIRAKGYLRDRRRKDDYVWRPDHQGPATRRWVGWRAHELGWTPARFAEFDRKLASRSERNEHRIERIGKKYQWIAVHELAGRLADAFCVKRGWGEFPAVYEGPWQVSAREIDPSLLVTGTRQLDRDDTPGTWWSPHEVRWTRDAPARRRDWMADEGRDVPDPAAQIDVVDLDGRRWLVLDMSSGRNQWAPVEGERVIHRMTWHKVTSMLVPRKDVARLAQHLAAVPGDRDHPRDVEIDSESYLGEYLWHPSCLDVKDGWRVGRATNGILAHGTVVDRRFERSGHDYSIDSSFDMSIPSPTLLRGLDLRLARGRSLDFADASGRILFKDPSTKAPGFSAAVVDRDALLSFLARADLDIVWTFTGEKSAHGGRRHGKGWGGQLEWWGIYSLSGGAIAGSLVFKRKEPDGRQLDEFMAGA